MLRSVASSKGLGKYLSWKTKAKGNFALPLHRQEMSPSKGNKVGCLPGIGWMPFFRSPTDFQMASPSFHYRAEKKSRWVYVSVRLQNDSVPDTQNKVRTAVQGRFGHNKADVSQYRRNRLPIRFYRRMRRKRRD